MKTKLSKEVLELKKLDPILGAIILEDLVVLEEANTDRNPESVFNSLLRSIISQQISVSAANSIRAKFLNLFGNKFPTAKELLEINAQELRKAGLSSQKISYLKNVAEHFEKENLHEKDFSQMSDSEIIEDLTRIKGVGEWTVEMILIFTLKRPDIFSYKDLGLINAILKLYKINPKKYKSKNLKKKILSITAKWSPHRSLACRYLWAHGDVLKKVRK